MPSFKSSWLPRDHVRHIIITQYADTAHTGIFAGPFPNFRAGPGDEAKSTLQSCEHLYCKPFAVRHYYLGTCFLPGATSSLIKRMCIKRLQ